MELDNKIACEKEQGGAPYVICQNQKYNKTVWQN